MKQLFFIFFLAGMTGLVSAQTDTSGRTDKLVLIGKRQGNNNMLRWTALDYVSWQEAAQNGVVIERCTITKKGPNGIYVPIAGSPFKPLPLEQWKTRFGAKDTVAGAAAQTQFGQSIPLSDGSDPLSAVSAMRTQQAMMHGIGMMLADWRPDLAEAMALRMKDADIDPGLTYVYRLYVVQSENIRDTAYCVVKPTEKWKAPSVFDLKALELEHAVQLSWTYEGNVYAPSGYFIERSADGGRSFIPLNTRPFIKIQTPESALAEEDRIVYTDSLSDNYRPYQYRITAFNAFGETGKDSKVITAMGRDRTPPPQPMIDEPLWKEGEGLVIRWDIDDPGDIKGFMVAHSNSADIGFTPLHTGLLPPGSRTFTDPTGKARGNINYYTVTAVDSAGNAISALPRHFFVDDVTPPATPTGLKADVNASGKVVLRWQANKEPDLMGYNVFFANAPDHEMIQLNGEPIKVDSFVHDLELVTLTEFIYYRVVALDESFNPSPFSAVFKVKKPDILPPAAPLITDVNANDHSVTVTWTPSPSHDAVGVQVFRRKSGQEAWVKLADFNKAQVFFTDSLVEVGQLYEYTLKAIDDDGLLSEFCTPHTGRAYPAFRGAGLVGFKAEKDKESAAVLLKWQFKSRPDAHVYLYKGGADGVLRLFANVESKENQFTDIRIPAGKRTSYAAKVIYDSGAESDMTPVVEVVLE